jgi:hypothetical protein
MKNTSSTVSATPPPSLAPPRTTAAVNSGNFDAHLSEICGGDFAFRPGSGPDSLQR